MYKRSVSDFGEMFLQNINLYAIIHNILYLHQYIIDLHKEHNSSDKMNIKIPLMDLTKPSVPISSIESNILTYSHVISVDLMMHILPSRLGL